MSVWTEFDGTLTIHKKEHFSFLNYIEEFFENQCSLDYVKPVIKTSSTEDYHKTHFSMSICESNIGAVEVIDRIFKGLPKHSTVDARLFVRYVK